MADRDNREAILGKPLARLLRNLAETSCNEGSDALFCRLMDCKTAIEDLLSDRDLAEKRIEKIERELRASRSVADEHLATILELRAENEELRAAALGSGQLAQREGVTTARNAVVDFDSNVQKVDIASGEKA